MLKLELDLKTNKQKNHPFFFPQIQFAGQNQGKE